VAAHETDRFARQLDQLLADATRLRAMQTASRQAAEKQFCWEREAPRLLSAVEHVIGAAPIEIQT
jgi:hypothetical protein